MARTLIPNYRPLLTKEERHDLTTERIPAAALGATIPIAILFRKRPWRTQLVKATEAAGLGALSATGGFLGVHGVRGLRERSQQRHALKGSPLKSNERLQLGPGGKHGVWRKVGEKHLFIEVKRFSLEGKDLHIDCAMGSKKRIPLKPGRTR